LSLRASLGVATYPEGVANASALGQAADRALSVDKQRRKA
jgi:hypothetical protein